MTEEVVSLKKTDAGNLASNERMMVVGELERELLRKMPASDACSWDRTGMLVGNPMDTVRGVAVALDPTIHAVEEAHAHGANVPPEEGARRIYAASGNGPCSWCRGTPRLRAGCQRSLVPYCP